ncbi:MAG: hypothetical protein ABJL44_16245 [Algibacter sp.]
MRKLKSLLLLSVIGFAACETETANVDVLGANLSDTVTAEVAFEETEDVLDNIAIYSDSAFGIETTTSKASDSKDSTYKKHGRSGYFKDCADIVVEELDGTTTTTITFTEDCEDRDGNVISGTITKVKTESDNGKEKTVIVDGLMINGYVINGTKTYVYTVSNANGNPEMMGSVNMSIETDEGTATKVGSRTVEITAGGDTDTCTDDEKTITGSFVYTNAEGVENSVTITTDLVKPADCKYIASGIKVYTTEAGTVTLDYGDGTCDDVATKTDTDGTETEVTLGKRRKRH